LPSKKKEGEKDWIRADMLINWLIAIGAIALAIVAASQGKIRAV